MAKRVVMELPIDVNAVQLRVAPFVEATRSLWRDRSRTEPLYYGPLSHQGFELRRRINYRNSFLPTSRATFRPNIEGTTVELVIGAPIAASALAIIILGSILLIGLPLLLVAGLIVSAAEGTNPAPFLPGLIPLILPIVIGGIFYTAYRVEAGIAERELTEILKGLTAPPPLVDD